MSPVADYTPIPPSAGADDLIGRKLGQFRIEERIGEGGMGIVYRAVDETLKRSVALKVLPPAKVGDPRRHARLMREAQSLAQLSHANIATVFAVGEQDDVVYIAMELVDGPSLSDLLRKQRLEVDRVVSVALDVARALAHAHESGIVHRDLKPSNVVLRRGREVKLLDFGLAKLVAPGPGDVSGSDETMQQLTTAEGAVVGTPVYMSPEQARGTAVDARSDVFSFGTMLYEMLAGTPPFLGDTSMDTLYAIAHKPEEPLAGREGVPSELARIVHKCLDKDAALRYQNTQHLVDDLEAFARSASTVSGSGSGALRHTLAYEPAGADAKGRRRLVWIAGAAVVAAAACAIAWIALAGDDTPGERGSPPAAVEPARTAVTARSLTKRASNIPLLGVPTISYDKKLLVYADGNGMWVRDVDGGTPRPLPLPQGMTAYHFDAFSDSPRVLAVIVSPKRGLAIIDLAEGEVVEQVQMPGVKEASISRDGGSALVLRQDRLSVYDFATGDESLIVDVREGEIVYGLRWSPDGRYVAVVRDPGRGRAAGARVALDVLSRDGSTIRRVIADDALRLGVGAAGVEWLADGDLVYTLARGTGSAIYRQPMADGAASGEPTLIYELPDAHAIDFDAVDGTVLITTFRSQTDAFLAPLENGGRALGQATQLTFERGLDWVNDWTSDDQLILESDRFGTRDVFVCDSRCDKPKRLLQDVPARLHRDVVAVGADLLVWQRAEAGGDQVALVRAPIAGGDPVKLLETSESSLPQVRCARDTGACVIGTQSGNRFVLDTFDPKTGDFGRRLYRRPRTKSPKRFAMSPDGTRVAIVEGEQSVIIVGTSGGAAKELQFAMKTAQYVAWSADGSRLFVTGMEFLGNTYAMISMDLEGNLDVLWVDDAVWAAMPVPSPDGTQLAFSIRDWEENLWLLEGL